MKSPEPVAVPPKVVTTTFTAPSAWAGMVAIRVVSLMTEKLVAAVPPKLTAIAVVRSVPVIVTLVPPRVLPLEGAMLATVGMGAKLATCSTKPEPPF